jgi:hypothetical protein
MNMCEWPAFFFSIDFCSASTSLRFSEAPRKLDHRCLRSVRLSLICFTYSLEVQSTDTSLFTCQCENWIKFKISREIEPMVSNDICAAVSRTGSVSDPVIDQIVETRFAPCAPGHGWKPRVMVISRKQRCSARRGQAADRMQNQAL